MTKSCSCKRGFTLAEMAIVLILMGLAMTMGLMMVTATLDNAAYSETKSKQERIKIALIGYLRTNGRLPCPDITADPTDALYGLQDRQSNADPDSACTAPGTTVQVVPWRDLGLTRDDVTDGWGDFFTYRVAKDTDLRNWTSRSGAGAPFDINQLSSPALNVLTLSENNGGGATSIVPSPVVVIVSHGKNGLGARTVKGTINTAPSVGTDEAINATVGSSAFIRRPVTDAVGGGGAFDDLVAFMAPQDLLQPLISEGSLKTCYAYCSSVPSCTGGGVFSCAPAGVPYCSGGPSCTQGGSPACTAGVPQCLSGSGCSASNIPVGVSALVCP